MEREHVVRRLLQLLGITAGFLLLAVVGWWFYVEYETSPSSWPVESFSSAKWKEAAPEQRYLFYRDLAASGELDGTTKQKIIELLGPPDFEDPAGTYMTYVVKYRDPGEWSFNSVYLLDIRLDPATGEIRNYLVRGD